MRLPLASLAFAIGVGAAAAAPIQVAAPAPQSKPAEPRQWLTALIAKLEADPVANPPARIAQFDYRDEKVYYLPPRCCDIPSTLYDAAGAVICSPDGGFTGKGDGRCPDFFAERKNDRTIWSDKRKRR